MLMAALAVAALVGCQGPWLPPTPGAIIRGFQPPAQAYGSGHRGVDAAAAPGDPVRSPVSGEVLVAARIGGRGVLVVRDGEGRRATLEPVETLLSEGTLVEAGQLVGTVGRGGHCDGRCLHLGARIDEPGAPATYLSPLPLLGCHAVLRPVA